MTFYNAGCVKSSFFVHFASKIPTDFIPACQQTRLAAVNYRECIPMMMHSSLAMAQSIGLVKKFLRMRED